MIYDLSKRKWKPYVFMVGIVFVPICVASIIGTILDFSIKMLIVTICLILVYAIIIFIAKKVAGKECGAIFLKEENLVILAKGIDIQLHFDEIIQIEYFRSGCITWLFGGAYPYEVCITFYDKRYGIEQMFSCFLDYKEAKEIAQKTNTKFKVR